MAMLDGAAGVADVTNFCRFQTMVSFDVSSAAPAAKEQFFLRLLMLFLATGTAADGTAAADGIAYFSLP